MGEYNNNHNNLINLGGECNGGISTTHNNRICLELYILDQKKNKSVVYLYIIMTMTTAHWLTYLFQAARVVATCADVVPGACRRM